MHFINLFYSKVRVINLTIVQKAENLLTQLINWRRHLHKYPELSFHEENTAKFIARELSKIDNLTIETGVGGHGVVATLRSEEHTSELQSRGQLVCRLLLAKENGTWL